jgi:hypothetical protein
MSKHEADALMQIGKLWFAQVWIKNDGTARTNIINGLNQQFIQGNLPIRVNRGWKDYDPVVKVNGKAHTYAALAVWATSQNDGGVGAAQLFQQWYSGNNVTLSNLPAHLQALAVITHFAEVGRGYSSSLELSLYAWIDDIAQANTKNDAIGLWYTYKDRFAPSLKYDEDVKTEWTE